MYESHNMRHIGFLQVDELSMDPWDLRRHICYISVLRVLHYTQTQFLKLAKILLLLEHG